jgi:hypothetical protein
MSFKSCSDSSTTTSHLHIKAAEFLNFVSKSWGDRRPPRKLCLYMDVPFKGEILGSPLNIRHDCRVPSFNHVHVVYSLQCTDGLMIVAAKGPWMD